MRSRTVMILLLTAGLVLTGCGDDGSTTTTSNDVSADACTTRAMEFEPDGSPTRPIIRVDDAGLTSAVAGTFCAEHRVTAQFTRGPDKSTISYGPVLPEEDAACIGAGLVEVLGPDRVRELRLDLGPWSALGFGLSYNNPFEIATPVDEAEAGRIVDTMRGCSTDWELLFIRSATEGADKISEASARCTADRLDDAQGHSIMVHELDAPDLGSNSWTEVLQPLLDALDQCLTPAELDRLDWN